MDGGDDLSATGAGADDYATDEATSWGDTATDATAFGGQDAATGQSAASSWQRALSDAGLNSDATVRTDTANAGTDPNIVLAQAGPVVPGGIIQRQTQGVNPLDPAGINVTPTPQEQVAIAATLNAVNAGATQGLNPHPYNNYPDRVTGAQMPHSAAGYTTYDVGMGGTGRGANRLLIDNDPSGGMYYTNDHYQSFFKLTVLP